MFILIIKMILMQIAKSACFRIFPVSAKTGEGMEDLENWLRSLIE